MPSPLYVGKAVSLQARIRQHLDPMSDLSIRLRQAGIRIQHCILAYAVIDETPAAMDDQTMFLIEEIMT